MRLTIIVGCHCSYLNGRIGYVYTGPLFSGNYCTTWLSQLYSGRVQPTLRFLLSFLHCWCQGNDNVMTFTWQVSLFWTLREKGIDIIEWLHPATFMQCIHNSQGNPARILILGEKTHSERWSNLSRSYSWEGCACGVMLRASPFWGPGGSPTALVRNPIWDRQHSSSRHIFLPEQASTKTADLFMVLLSHSLLLCFHKLFNSFPPENQSPLNYVPLRWAATNWKCGRWNKGTLVGQTHNTQLPRQWGRSGWGGKPTTGEYICLSIRKEYSLGQHWDLRSPLSPPNLTNYSASLIVFRWHTHLCSQGYNAFIPNALLRQRGEHEAALNLLFLKGKERPQRVLTHSSFPFLSCFQWNKCINTTCLTVLNTALNQEAWLY